MRDVHRVLAAAEHLRRVVHDARRGDRDLGGKQEVAAAQPARAEDVLARRSAALRPEARRRDDRARRRPRPTRAFPSERETRRPALRRGGASGRFSRRQDPVSSKPERFSCLPKLCTRRCNRGLDACPTERPARRRAAPQAIPSAAKPINYYRPRGSAEVRQLIDNGFQAFNAGRLSEACHIFTEKMLAPENDTTIGLTVAGAMTPAGLGGCVIEMMERGLVDFIISTGANLYHDLHYALNFTLHRGSPFLDDVELYEKGIIRIYDVLFPATVLLETDAYIRDFLVRSKLNGPMSTAEFHYRLGLDLLERNPAARSIRSSRRGGAPACRSTPRRRATARSG